MRSMISGSYPLSKARNLSEWVSDGDLKKASVSKAVALDVQELLYHTYKTKIKDIMTNSPITMPWIRPLMKPPKCC